MPHVAANGGITMDKWDASPCSVPARAWCTSPDSTTASRTPRSAMARSRRARAAG